MYPQSVGLPQKSWSMLRDRQSSDIETVLRIKYLEIRRGPKLKNIAFEQTFVDNNYARLPGCLHAIGARYLVCRQLFDQISKYTSLPGCGGAVRARPLPGRQLL